MKNLVSLLIVISLIILSCVSENDYDIAVVVRNDATKLESFAAEELCYYINKLYGKKVQPSTQSHDAKMVFYVTTRKYIPGKIKFSLPGNLTEQGIFIHPFKTNGQQSLILTGGSPVAVLWAVYELVERWGVRYLVHEDVFPDPVGKLVIPKADIYLEPNMRIRAWRLVNELAAGPVSWSLEENKRFLHQLAKMKYNRVLLSFWPSQPFVHYSFNGMEKPTPLFHFGAHFPLSKETVGYEHFTEYLDNNKTEFINPDFIKAKTPEELEKLAINWARGIIAEAKFFGMETAMTIQPFEWPKEFMKVLPGSEPVHQVGNITAGPGRNQSMADPLLREVVATIFRAYVETYPEVDYVQVGMPEHRGWTGQAKHAYEILTKKYGVTELGTFEELCARARLRTSFPNGGGQRVEAMVKGDLASLAFFDSLIEEKKLLAKPGGGPNIKLIYSGISAELFPLLAKMIPEGGEVLSFIDYTASRQLKQRELLRQRPPEGLTVTLYLTLADDNVGVLPQLATGSIYDVMNEIRRSGWSGFCTRYWTVGDLVPTVHFLALASWDSLTTPQSAYKDLFINIAGKKALTPILEALSIIEEITVGLDHYGLGFAFPIHDMITKLYKIGGLPKPIKADHQRYRKALSLLWDARKLSDPRGYTFLDYLIGRLYFAVRYLDAAEAFGATHRAEKAGNRAEAVKHIEVAYNAIRQAIQSWADIAKDHGDLGAVALLNEYCYQPIKNKRNELQR